MSSSGIISPNNGKIFNDLLPNPYPYPAQANTLAQVLLADNDAGNQDAVNFNTLESTNVETTLVHNPLLGGVLSVGSAGETIRVLGATAKGSILVGDGTDTKELVAGANGLVLTTNSSAATGLEWAVGGGGGGVASVSAGDNIAVTGTATNPIVAVAAPLNATLNLGTQNTTGTTGALTYDDAVSNNKGVLGAISLILSDSTFATGDQTQTNKSGYSAIGSTDTTILSKTGLSKTLGATALTLSSSTAPIQITPNGGTSCNVSVSGNGNFQVNQTSTGGANQPATSVINTNGGANPVHLDLYKNSPSPAANDGIAGVSYHANNASGTKVEYARIQADQRDTTAGSENGSVSVYVATNSPTPAEYMRFNGLTNTTEMYKALETRGNFLQNTTAGSGLTLYQSANSGNITLNNVGTSGAINFQTTSGGINITANQSVSIVASVGTIGLTASSTDGVKVAQSVGARTQLRTTITPTYASQPVEFFPAVHIDNGNASSISLDLPKVQYQNLVLMNMGITPASLWSDIGGNNGSVDSMFLAAGGYVWLGVGGNVYITDTNFSIIYQTITLAGSSSGAGSPKALAFWEDGIYVYIGGDFQSVNGNAQPQYGLTRIYLGGGVGLYTEDPMWDSSSGAYGVNGTIEALAIFAGNLYAGGSFNSFAGGGGTADYIFQVQNYTGTGGSQVYTINLNLATNSSVYALTPYGSTLFVGGSFSFPYSYLATYDGSNWNNVDGNNFNGPVYSTCNSSLGSYILVGGSFSHSGHSNLCYIDANNPTLASISAGVSPSSLGKNSVYASGYDMIQTTTTDVYKSTSFQTWTTLGQSNGGYIPSTIFVYNGNPFASYSNYSFVRTNVVNPQSATFSLPGALFLYGGVMYQNATFATKYSAQAFVADATANYYIPVGNPICSFS